MKVHRTVCLLLAIACVLAAGCGKEAAPPERAAPAPSIPNILLIVADALRADHMSMYGYERETTPRLAEWFESGTVYERAYSSASYTPPSVVGFLSGLMGPQHGVQSYNANVPEGLKLISTRLAEAGYTTGAVVSNPVLAASYCGLDAHFDHFDDTMDERDLNRDLFSRSAGRTTDAVLAWLESERGSGKPLFLYVHYFEPHGPYTPPDDKPADFSHPDEFPIPVERIPEYQRVSGLLDGLEYVDLYDEEVAYLDREAGRLLESYGRMFPLDGTLAIFSSDHGETLMDHERWFRHSYHVYEELIRVPLALRGPGFGRARVAGPVSLVDVAPTVLTAAQLAIPPGFQCEALGLAPRENRFIFSESQWELCCAIRGAKKWLAIIKEDGSLIDA